MSLKKTDKIIAIIGVLILIIAGIGIFLYVGTEETTSTEPTQEKVYDVTWEKHTGTMPSISGFAGKKVTYTDPFEVNAEGQGSVITQVDVLIIWKDDVVSRILKMGKDTLTANINLVGGEPKTHTSKGSSDNTTAPLIFDSINSAPADMTGFISEDEAWAAIDNQYANKNKASFETEITVKTGEKFGIRPLKLLRFLKDKGNDFTLEITYTYYTPIVLDSDSPPPVPPSDDGSNTGYHYTNLPGKQ
jgi:hypothetical protein